ncbi:MAG: glycoside hydrolase family 3 C-terminal domain-containing protein, partial [Pseudomonadota bacterium]
RLPEDQVALIKAVASANPNTIVVIVSGSAIICDWAGDVAAILQTFYSGMEGGSALANLLYGVVNPSGKLPFTVARDESDYPFFDKDADDIEYGPLHGYALMAASQTQTQFAFGHGLSYTSFDYRALKVRRTEHGLEVDVTVINMGDYDGDEIVQLYVGFPDTTVSRPAPLLRGFDRVFLRAGERKTVRFDIPEQDLKYWDETSHNWRLEAGRHFIKIGTSAKAFQQASIEL